MKVLYLTLSCHYHNDSCIKMGNEENHFNVSLMGWGWGWGEGEGQESQDGVHRPQVRERRAEAENRTHVDCLQA